MTSHSLFCRHEVPPSLKTKRLAPSLSIPMKRIPASNNHFSKLSNKQCVTVIAVTVTVMAVTVGILYWGIAIKEGYFIFC